MASREGQGERGESEMSFIILLAAGLLHEGDRHKIRWKFQAPGFRQNILNWDLGDQDE